MQSPVIAGDAAVHQRFCDRLDLVAVEVHNNDKYNGHCHVKVDIYFTVVGMMNVPDEREIQTMMEEMKNNPKLLKHVS